MGHFVTRQVYRERRVRKTSDVMYIFTFVIISCKYGMVIRE